MVGFAALKYSVLVAFLYKWAWRKDVNSKQCGLICIWEIKMYSTGKTVGGSTLHVSYEYHETGCPGAPFSCTWAPKSWKAEVLAIPHVVRWDVSEFFYRSCLVSMLKACFVGRRNLVPLAPGLWRNFASLTTPSLWDSNQTFPMRSVSLVLLPTTLLWVRLKQPLWIAVDSRLGGKMTRRVFLKCLI